MLYLIGTGLSLRDIPFRAIEISKKADRRILESYTSLADELRFLESLIGKVEIATRREIEEGLDEIIRQAASSDIAILVIGDPLAATTHYTIIHEARKQGIRVETIHAGSVFTAITNTGLMLYKFGRTISIPFKDKTELPISVYEYIAINKNAGLHSLLLLDLDPLNNRYMDPYEAISILLELEQHEKKGVIKQGDEIVICSRLGLKEEKIIYISIRDLLEEKPVIGKPPYCIVLPGKISEIEKEFLEYYRFKPKN